MTLRTDTSFNTTTTYLLPKRFADYLSTMQDYCLFLDIDGTLAKFTLDPKDSVIPRSTLMLLQQIQNQDVKVAIVTGRSLIEAKQMLSPLLVPIAATHGLEIDFADTINSNSLHKTNRQYNDAPVVIPNPKINLSRQTSANTTSSRFSECDKDRLFFRKGINIDIKELNAIKQSLNQYCLPYSDLTIEDKPYSCALHYRQNPTLNDVVYRLISKAVAPYPNWTLKQGKYVWEAVPQGANKGTAIVNLLKKMQNSDNLCAIFIGDDITDEAGFSVIQDEVSMATHNLTTGIGIKVGSELTSAHYYVHNIDEVTVLLDSFLTFCHKRTVHASDTENADSNTVNTTVKCIL